MSFFKHIYEKFVQDLTENLFKSSEKYFSTINSEKRTSFLVKGLLEILYTVYSTVDEKTQKTLKEDFKIFLSEIEKSSDLKNADFESPKPKDLN